MEGNLTDEKAPGGLAWVERLTALLLPIMRQRIERLGERASGAQNFYRTRAEQGRLFADYEIALAAKFATGRLPVEAIHEIGSGFGQLAFLLGWNGFASIGFEVGEDRYQTAKLMLDVLQAVDPELSGRIRLVSGSFPPPTEVEETREALVLATNLVATRSPQQQYEVVQAMRQYRYALVDVDRFFVTDANAHNSDRGFVFGLFAGAGFPKAKPFLDLGPSGCYYIFGNIDDLATIEEPRGRGRRTPAVEPVIERRPVPVIEPPDYDVQAINEFAVAFLAPWIDQTEDRRRSAGEYYRAKLAERRFFEDYDIAASEYVARHLPKTTRLFELGSGFGELAILLARHGFSITGFESEQARQAGAAALVAALAERGFPLSQVALIEDDYPDSMRLDRLEGENAQAALLCTLMTGDYVVEHIDYVCRSLALFDHLIIDIATFGERRDARSTQDLVARIRALGFEEVATVFSDDYVNIRHFAQPEWEPIGIDSDPPR